VGQDETGDFFENDLKEAGVNTMLFRRETVTGTAIALISPDSERTFATHLGAALELQATDLDPEYFRKYDILYLEGYLIYDRQLVEVACRVAKSMGMKIAIDLASYNVVDARLADFREIIGNYADIVFANEEEARSYTGADPEEALIIMAGECDIAVVKIGKDGSIIRRGKESVRIKSHPVNCRDTTGAGDLYAAGFLYGYAVDTSLERCGITGSLLAGNVIETIGARMDEMRWRDIKEYLKTQF
jgi:sugar/nucleoside kinase (ribokinase family)